MRRSHLLLPALGALALAGCSDRPEPIAPFNASGAASRSVSASPSGRYILASNSKFPADLAARVTALGGTLESVHSAGIAVVSGIPDAAASSLASISGVNDVEADEVISLDAPIAVAEADASATQDPSLYNQANPTLASEAPGAKS